MVDTIFKDIIRYDKIENVIIICLAKKTKENFNSNFFKFYNQNLKYVRSIQIRVLTPTVIWL